MSTRRFAVVDHSAKCHPCFAGDGVKRREWERCQGRLLGPSFGAAHTSGNPDFVRGLRHRVLPSVGPVAVGGVLSSILPCMLDELYQVDAVTHPNCSGCGAETCGHMFCACPSVRDD